MRIIKLQAEAFKRLIAVDITPEGDLVQITGRNAQGKTSVLDAIEVALGGMRSAPDMPIHDGESQARIVCDLEDLVVTRTFTHKGSGLTVEAKDGRKLTSPQKVLDALVGTLSFDPLGFTRMAKPEQLALLLELSGLDLAELDGRIEELKGQRLDFGRTLKNERAIPIPPHDDSAPAAPIVVEELMTKLREARTIVVRNSEIAGSIETCQKNIETMEKQIVHLGQEKQRTAMAMKDLQDAQLPEKDLPDLAALEERIAGAEAENLKLRGNEIHAGHAEKCAELESELRDVNHLLTKSESERKKAVREATFPVEGLGFDAQGVTFFDIPFDQCSGADQLRVSVAMGFALNPTLKVLLIRDGSLLDNRNLEHLAKMAGEAGAQVWIERVSDGERVGVYIEDGQSFQ